MTLLAEQLVDEWLNRQGFFTLRAVKQGVHEIDLLGVRPTNSGLEAWHVEVQVSFRPVSYIGKLTTEQQTQLGVAHANSSRRRSEEILNAGIEEWIGKKWRHARKRRMRDECWPGLDWSYRLVHGEVHEPAELRLIEARGIRLIPFWDVLDDLCKHAAGQRHGAAGTDIAEIVRFCNQRIGRPRQS